MALLAFPAHAVVFDPADCGGPIEIDFADQYAGCPRQVPLPDPDPDPPPAGGACTSPVIPEYKNFIWTCPGFSELTTVRGDSDFDVWHMGSATLVNGESYCIAPDIGYNQSQWSTQSVWRLRGQNLLVLVSPTAPAPPLPIEFTGTNIEWRGPIGNFTVTGTNIIVNGVCY